MLDRFFLETLHLDTYALLINFLGCAQDRVNYKKKLHAYLENSKEKYVQPALSAKKRICFVSLIVRMKHVRKHMRQHHI